jgi:antitoxin CptB
MKELDLLLERWLRTQYEQATPAQRSGFEALLELPDPDLLHYLLGGELPADPQLAAAVKAVLTPRRIMSSLPAEPSGTTPI